MPPLDQNSMTPQQIVAELDRHIVGQNHAKRAVAIAIRNRWRRQQLPDSLARDIWPKNILMAGPTGVGKTEIARRLAALVKAPFLKVEATKFTEVGYHGRDVDSMIRDLLERAIAMIRTELTDSIRTQVDAAVEQRLVQTLQLEDAGDSVNLEALRQGQYEHRSIPLVIEEQSNMTAMLEQAGVGVEFAGMFEKMMPSQRQSKRLAVREARGILFAQEADKLIEQSSIIAEAIDRTEQSGIIFLDEIDKIASAGEGQGPDVSRQGVQRDLLPIVEGSTVTTRHGPVKTDHILFIAAGAFYNSEVDDLMPELQGRFPIRVQLSDLSQSDLARILREPENSLTRQQVELLRVEGVEVRFTDDGIEAIAKIAYEVNRRAVNLGARRLHTIMERVFEPISFDASEMKGKPVVIDGALVRKRLGEEEEFK